LSVFLTFCQGKTILASVIIEEIQLQAAFSLAFFFCKHKDPRRDNFKAVLRGLFVQLMRRQPDLVPFIYEKCTSSGEVILESLALLKELFGSVLRNSTKAFIIVDGVDECDQVERKLILTYLNGLMSSIEDQGNDAFRVLYISRDEGDIRKLLSKSARRTINPRDSEHDIKEYTTSRSLKVQGIFEISDTVREDIVSRVCNRAKGEY
jgi:hypothetical protein